MLIQSNSDAVTVFSLSHLEEVLQVIDTLRERQTVIVNLDKLHPEKIQRVIDWISGCAIAIDGQIICLGKSCFLFAPGTVKVIADQSKKMAIAPKVS